MDELATYNRERWNELSREGVAFGRPWLDLTPEKARRRVDPEGLLGEIAGMRVLLLAGGGGQQSAGMSTAMAPSGPPSPGRSGRLALPPSASKAPVSSSTPSRPSSMRRSNTASACSVPGRMASSQARPSPAAAGTISPPSARPISSSGGSGTKPEAHAPRRRRSGLRFYFGVGQGGAHITVAFSRDLVHWAAPPEPLYKAGGNPSGLDTQYAHKISLITTRRTTPPTSTTAPVGPRAAASA